MTIIIYKSEEICLLLSFMSARIPWQICVLSLIIGL